jgi:hypothetical protein
MSDGPALKGEAEYVMEQTSLAVTEKEEDSVFYYSASLTDWIQ